MARSTTTTFVPLVGKDGLAGGLNVSDHPMIVRPNEMVLAENVAATVSLSRHKRPGQDFYRTTKEDYSFDGDPVRGVIEYNRFLASTGEQMQDMFVHVDDKVYSIPDRTADAVDRSDSFTFSTTAVPRYQIFEGKLFFVSSDPADGYKKWDGTVASPGDVAAATGPVDGDGTLLGVYRARMVMAGVPLFPFRVYISAPLDAEDWANPATSTSFDLDYDGDPEGVTAIFPEFEGRLYIATRRSLYELNCTDAGDIATYSIRRIAKGIGCASQNSVQSTMNDIVWISDRGLHSLSKTITSDQTEKNFLSRDIQRIFTELLNPQAFKQAQGVWDENSNLYLLSCALGGQSTNNVILAYNMNTGLWNGTWLDIDARSLGVCLISNRQFVVAGREDGKLVYLNSQKRTDLDEGFSFKFKTGRLIGNPTCYKDFKSLTILCASVNVAIVNVSWEIEGFDTTLLGSTSFEIGHSGDLLGSSFVLGESRLGIGRFLPKTVTLSDKGYSIQIQVSVSGTSDIEFFGFVIEAEESETYYVA